MLEVIERELNLMSRGEFAQLKAELMPELNDAKEDYALHLEKLNSVELKIKEEQDPTELSALEERKNILKSKTRLKRSKLDEMIGKLADLSKNTDWTQG